MTRSARNLLSCLIVLAVAGVVLAAGGEAFGQYFELSRADVWSLAEKPFYACLKKNPAAVDCLTQVMERSGASAKALEVNRRLDGDGFLSELREMGRVDLATMTFPMRANTNQALFLVNGTPPLISTELDESTIDITKAPGYAAIKNAYPEVTLWPTSAVFRSCAPLGSGGQRFVFSYALLNGCHACAVAGHALVAFDFTLDGVFQGSKFLGLEPK